MSRKKLRERKESLVREVSTIGPVFRGSVAQVHLTCGKSNCRCQKGQRHRALYVSYRLGGRSKVAYVPADRAWRLRNCVRTGGG